jgi:uncharacterized linocin/CFP29 family protein
VAAQVLPTTIHPDVTAVAVPDRTLDYKMTAVAPPDRRLTVDSTPATFFTSLSVNVVLTSQEAADPDQGAALVQLRKAASMIARLEDALIFGGQSQAGATPPGANGLQPVFTVSGGGAQPGLVAVPPVPGLPASYFPRLDIALPITPAPGNFLAQKIIDAVGLLEGQGHSGPFACMLGQGRFSDLHDPSPSLVLPRDRVAPILDGPILRSSAIPPDHGVVIALGSASMEIVVSSELHVRFLQITTEPRFVLRVSERVALRVSDWTSVLVLHPKTDVIKMEAKHA